MTVVAPCMGMADHAEPNICRSKQNTGSHVYSSLPVVARLRCVWQVLLIVFLFDLRVQHFSKLHETIAEMQHSVAFKNVETF